MSTAVDARPVWQEPHITGINRLRARSVSRVFASGLDALAEKAEQMRSLNGDWQFKLVSRPEATPAKFMQPDFKDAAWDSVPVPGNFTMQGYVNPQYTNVVMPFTERPPLTPERNPTGLYRTSFKVPAAWNKKRILLRFGSIESVGQIWLNGQPVGVVKDSRLPSEFDITELVQQGENCLAVQVIQFSDASFIEDQDQWWQAGIARDVDLIACHPTFIEDVFANADYDCHNGSGSLDLTVRLNNMQEAGWSIKADVYNEKGKIVGKPMEETAHFFNGPHPHGKHVVEGMAHGVQEFKKINAWSHEEPQLYTLIVRLYNPKGNEVEATRIRIGFRRIEVKNRELLLNGKAVLIKGVNRHEHDERTGKVVSRELMRRDVEVLKQHNVNAVRTSHYPPDAYFFDLCDEYGLWCIDEANIETHHYYDDMCHDPAYAAAFLDRGMRMVLRDRNHPCIFSWSLGNESGYGPNHDAMAGWMRHADPSRIIHYEGAINGNWQGGHAGSDLICPMYPRINHMVNWAETTEDWRPFIMCEFVHAMGNSCGSLHDYWREIEKHHGLQGGFIWEMLDHGIVKQTSDGREYWGYGGDFGDKPNDINFVCDGLVWPDRTPHTTLLEARAVYQPVAARLLNPRNKEIAVINKHDFISLKHYRIEWELLADGEIVDSGRLPRLDILPGAERLVRVPASIPPDAAAKELFINLHCYDGRDTALPGKDYLAAVCQLALPPLRRARQRQRRPEGLLSCEQDKRIHVSGADCELIFNQQSGSIESWQVDGVQLLEQSCHTDIWRAAVDNDGLKLRHSAEGRRDEEPRPQAAPLAHWIYAGYDRMQRSVDACKVRAADDSVVISWRERSWGRNKSKIIKTQHQLEIFADGSMHCEHAFQVDKGLYELPRLGVRFQVPAGLEQMAWYGLGPVENYSDRQSCARIGQWQSTVSDQYVPYIMPQEHGHIADLRRLSLRNDAGRGFDVLAETHCEGNISHYSSQALYEALHTVDLQPEAHSYLNLDAAHRGLGTGSCGPQTLEQYQVLPGNYRLVYRLASV